MVNDFLQYLQYEKSFSSHTVLSYRNDLFQFAVFLNQTPETFDATEITSSDIRAWIMQLSEQGMNARSIARKVSALKSFWRFLQLRGEVTVNPTLKVILPKTKKPLPVFCKHREIVEALDRNPAARRI